MLHVHHRVLPSRTLAWFCLGIGLFLIAIFSLSIPEYRRDGVIVGFCALSGLFLLLWKGKDFVLYLLTPRQLILDAAGLSLGSRSFRFDEIASLQLDHDSGKLVIRFKHSGKFVLRLSFWTDADDIYDTLATELTARLGPSIASRIKMEGSMAFGSVVVSTSDLKHKGWTLPYVDIGSIRMQHEGSNTGSMDYLVFRTHTGRSCKIDRSSIVNEALLLDFLSQRLPTGN